MSDLQNADCRVTVDCSLSDPQPEICTDLESTICNAIIRSHRFTMSDPSRSESSLGRDGASGADPDAKIEQLLLLGLDHYFAAQYDQAINVWTRVLFLDRNHPRARAYVEQFGLRTLYAADLDAIRGGEMQGGIISRLAAIGQLWIDAGISGAPSAQRVIDLGAARAVVGLETLSSFDALAAICDEVGAERVAFSLDLRGGEPMGLNGVVRREPVHELAARAAGAGAGAIIVIDLARVGSAAGPDFDLLSRVRAAAPGGHRRGGVGVGGSRGRALGGVGEPATRRRGGEGRVRGTSMREWGGDDRGHRLGRSAHRDPR